MDQKPEEKKVLKRTRKEEDEEMTEKDQSGKLREKTLSTRQETRHGANFDANSTQIPKDQMKQNKTRELARAHRLGLRFF